MTLPIFFLLFQDAVDLPMEVSTPERSFQSVIELPDEASIAHLVTGFAAEDVSLEIKEHRLFAKLLRAVEGSLDIIGGSGRLYRIRIRPAAKGLSHLRLPGTPGAKRSEERSELPAPLQLIRSLRVGTAPEGAITARADAPVFEGSGMTIRLEWIVRWQGLVGLVCEVRNVGRRPLTLDPSRVRGEGLRVVGLQRWKLPAGETTRLFLVFGHASE